MRTALRWVSGITLILYITCVAVGVAAAMVGYRQDSLAFAPLLLLGLPWTMAARWMSTGSVGIGVVLVSAAVLINAAILTAATRRLSRRSH